MPFPVLALSTNGYKHTRLDKIIFESPEVCAEPSIGHCGFNSTGNSNDAIYRISNGLAVMSAKAA